MLEIKNKHNSLKFLLGVTLSTLLFGCSNPENNTESTLSSKSSTNVAMCGSDKDCKGDRICDKGECKAIDTTSQTAFNESKNNDEKQIAKQKEKPVKNDNVDKQQALEKALAFGNSVHCNGTAFDENKPLNSVYLIDDSNDDNNIKSYAVLQLVDIGCAGGSGTTGFILTPVQQQGSRFFVDKESSENGDLFEKINDENFNSRFIKRANYDSNTKKLNLVTLGYGENDGNNFPSKKWKYVISLDTMTIDESEELGNN